MAIIINKWQFLPEILQCRSVSARGNIDFVDYIFIFIKNKKKKIIIKRKKVKKSADAVYTCVLCTRVHVRTGRYTFTGRIHVLQYLRVPVLGRESIHNSQCQYYTGLRQIDCALH